MATSLFETRASHVQLVSLLPNTLLQHHHHHDETLRTFVRTVSSGYRVDYAAGSVAMRHAVAAVRVSPGLWQNA